MTLQQQVPQYLRFLFRNGSSHSQPAVPYSPRCPLLTLLSPTHPAVPYSPGRPLLTLLSPTHPAPQSHGSMLCRSCPLQYGMAPGQWRRAPRSSRGWGEGPGTWGMCSTHVGVSVCAHTINVGVYNVRVCVGGRGGMHVHACSWGRGEGSRRTCRHNPLNGWSDCRWYAKHTFRTHLILTYLFHIIDYGDLQ